MEKYYLNQLGGKIKIVGVFDDTCILFAGKSAMNAIENGKLKLIIKNYSQGNVISNLKVTLMNSSGYVSINVGNNDAIIEFGENVSGAYDLRLWRNSKVVIGNETTSNGVRIICDNSQFSCGNDCMFSDEIIVQTSDQHGVVDLTKGVIINDEYKSISLGDHVWLGRRSMLLGSVNIGTGSIVGAGSIVTSDVPEKSISVGVPSKIIRTDSTWSRSPVFLDSYSESFIIESQMQATPKCDK